MTDERAHRPSGAIPAPVGGPAWLPVTSDQLATLDEPDRALLHRLLREPAEYVDHQLFARPNAERILFGGPAELVGNSTYFREYPDDTLPESPETTLSTAQEIRLFQQLNYARMRIARILRAHTHRRMSNRTLRELLGWAHRAIACRGRIVQANIALVLAMAKRTRLAGLDYNDLISEGNLALLRSVDKFDCSRGFKFSTYACRAILKSFSRVALRVSRYRGHFPTEFDPSLEKSDIQEARHDDQLNSCLEEIREILARNGAALNEIEQRVIRERFALDAPAGEQARGKTLEQVGALIGVTKERVRQIQNKALAKLRSVLEDTLAA